MGVVYKPGGVLPLPIDPLLPDIVRVLRRDGALVLEAPPGAGKTTRVPRAMLDGGMAERGEIVVLEPRRLAARLAAKRVAEELGEKLGETVGYTVRFDDVSSPRTRIRFVTEGTLTRRLLADPTLSGVSAVLLDEIHERHLQGDVALALLSRLRKEKRPDLVLVAMSATLDGDRVAAYLGSSVVRSEGKRFDVAIEHAPKPDDRPLESRVASAVRDLVRTGLDGHVLVFLPGAREIRRATEACAPLARDADLEVVQLHGELPPDEQDRAIAPSTRRKIILSTNVAESSVTIDGVAAVVDSGLARVVAHSPWTGIATMRTDKVSRASATQRAGRAGRTREGRAIRLYTKTDFDLRPEHDVAEVLRADLAETVLELRAHGIDLPTFPWLDPPPAASVDAAVTLLRRLGALDESSRVGAIGKRMLRFPLHPRLARLVVAAEDDGFGRDACLLAAVLAERDVRIESRASFGERARGDGLSARSDAIARFEDVRRALRDRLSPPELRARGLDPGATLAAGRARRQLERFVERGDEHGDEEDVLLRAILRGFPDRVARRRKPGSPELVLSGGGTATQAESSVVHGAPFVVVVGVGDVGERGGKPLARIVSEIEPEWLLELFPERVKDAREVRFDPENERVEVVERLLYDDLAIDETRGGKGAEDDVAAALADAATKRGLAAFVDPPDALESFLARVRFVGELDPSFPKFDEPSLRERMRALCAGRRSFAELRAADLAGELAGSLSHSETRKLAEWAPDRIELPSGRRAKVSYEPGKPPYVASRLQDFFGLAETPRVGGGRVPVAVHLLAPSQRPVQITQDLASFWKNAYPAIRRELARKYPRHAWPEDPRTPVPEKRR